MMTESPGYTVFPEVDVAGVPVVAPALIPIPSSLMASEHKVEFKEMIRPLLDMATTMIVVPDVYNFIARRDSLTPHSSHTAFSPELGSSTPVETGILNTSAQSVLSNSTVFFEDSKVTYTKDPPPLLPASKHTRSRLSQEDVVGPLPHLASRWDSANEEESLQFALRRIRNLEKYGNPDYESDEFDL